MQNGLTPYDKKIYKESKRRRKQARRAEYTGRIKPIRKNKKTVTVVAVVITVLLLSVAAVFLFVVPQFDKSGEDNISSQTDNNEQLLMVINRSSPVDSSYAPNLITCGNIDVNSLAYDELSAMLEDASESGVKLIMKKGYTSYDEQELLFSAKLSELMGSGKYSGVRAEAQAQKLVARADESEFQSGMLVEFDVSDRSAAAYLERNCVKFGFILRYPQDKEDSTGMIFNASVYRYVGRDNAANMRMLNMCLEEYVDYLYVQKEK